MSNKMTSEILESPTKIDSDKKDYRLIRLTNGLKVMLIKTAPNDKEGDAPAEKMSALSLSIIVGGNDDPKDMKGLSHFLEHMVFMGSEKYPGENDFMQYIESEGGSTNAFTSYENTVYFFKINENAFVGAMDRLAQFFIAPLMMKDAVDREIEAVESEFQSRANNNKARMTYLILALAHDDHKVNSFTVGNLTTLRQDRTVDEIYKRLNDHRKQYYVANRMKLCIQTNFELDKMQNLVEEYFVAIKSGDPAPVYDDNEYLNIFRAEFYEKMIYMKPTNNENVLELTWITPTQQRNYKCSPNTFLQNIFGYEGPGSLASYLKEKLLAITFMVGISHVSSCTSFEISINLTNHGLENIDEIMKAISSYCHLLRETSIEEHEKLYYNLKELSDVKHKYKRESTEITNAIQLSIAMNVRIDDKDLLLAPLQQFDGPAISEIIDILNDIKFNVLLITKNYHNFDKKQKYFGTEYASVDIPEQFIEFWKNKEINDKITLPALNPFISSNFEIHEDLDSIDQEFPVVVLKSDICEVWHKLGGNIKLPQGYINIQLKSPKANASVEDTILLELYQNMMDFHLYQKLYSAKKASLNYEVKLLNQELELVFDGFSDKIEQIVDILTKEMKNYNSFMNERMFENIKKHYNEEKYTTVLEADQISWNYMNSILQRKYYGSYEMYKQMDKLTFDDLKKFIDSYFNQMKIKILVQGNITKDHAVSIGNMVVENLGAGRLIDDSEVETNCRQINVGNACLKMKSFMINSKNSTTICYYELGAVDIRLLCLLDLMENMIQEPLMDCLRTKEQLCYSVWCESTNVSGVLGLKIVLNSVESKHSSEFIRSRVENFVVHDLKKIIDEMTDEQFNTNKNAQIKMKRISDVDLSKEVRRNWSEITSNQYIFNHRDVDANILATFTKADLSNLYYSKINTTEARKLTIQVIGSAVDEVELNDDQPLNLQLITEAGDAQLCGTIITDIEEYKKELIVHPYMVVKVLEN